MLTNFIYAKTKDLFLEQLGTGNILDEAIVFIEDTKEIWNRGSFYDCAPLKTDGDGSKFLADDGTYKEINIDEKLEEVIALSIPHDMNEDFNSDFAI